MCLAVAGRIVAAEGEGVGRRATVEVGGDVERDVSLALLPECAVGDWVIFHSGYALRTLGPEEVGRYLDLLAADS